MREKRIAQRSLEFEVVIASLRSELEMAKSLNSEYKNIANTSEQTLLKVKEEIKTKEDDFQNRCLTFSNTKITTNNNKRFLI